MGITTRYVGNEDRDWSPGGDDDDLQVEAAAVHDNDKEERRDTFVDYLQTMLQDISDDDTSDDTVVDKAMAKKGIHAVIQALTDPAVQLLPEGDTDHAAMWRRMYGQVHGHESTWTEDGIEEEDGEPRKVDTDKTVTSWYNEKCAITGETVDFPSSPTAVTLVPQFVVQSSNKLPLWARGFNILWGEGTVGDVAGIAGYQEVNTLPLGPTALRLWDRYMFALRPIQDPVDPQHNIYLQVVTLLQGEHPQGLPLPLSDGDVIHLQTSNPEQFPLPSLPLLQMQYRARRIVANIRTPNIMRDIFCGNPDDNIVEELDDDDDEDQDKAEDPEFPPYRGPEKVPADWTSLLKAAEETGVLSNALVDRWGKAILRYEQQGYRRGVRAERQRGAIAL